MPHNDAARRDQVATLLDRARGGDVEAGHALLPIVYDELHRIAERRMVREPAGSTLQPTALVHEAWLRLAGSEGSFENRAHFFGAAALAMRRVLIDHARSLRRTPRGAARERISLRLVDPSDDSSGEHLLDLLALDEALGKLEAKDPGKATVVTLRFLFGLSVEETAVALSCSGAKVKKDWAFARAWLKRELSRGGGAELE